jgi:N utilization substance protein B
VMSGEPPDLSPQADSSLPLRRRSQARALALQALCLFDALDEAFAPQLEAFLQDPEVLADLEIDSPPPPELLVFARSLAEGAWARRPRYDELLGRTAAHWSVQRMTPVDRNVLRLGLFELLDHGQAPAQVVLNEAIELARRFGDRDSPAFVNGVLDAIRRSEAAVPPANDSGG